MTKNQLEYWAQQETKRSNLANLAEVNRHNLAVERLTAANQSEAARHNTASEAEAHRANVQSEQIRRDSNAISWSGLTETVQHNRASEDTNLLLAAASGRQASAALQQASANQFSAITSRHAQQETARHNFMQELLKRQELTDVDVRDTRRNTETARANAARERIDREGNWLRAASQVIGTAFSTLAKVASARR
nr:putative ORF1 [Marmot picobirnavirus]